MRMTKELLIDVPHYAQIERIYPSEYCNLALSYYVACVTRVVFGCISHIPLNNQGHVPCHLVSDSKLFKTPAKVVVIQDLPGYC